MPPFPSACAGWPFGAVTGVPYGRFTGVCVGIGVPAGTAGAVEARRLAGGGDDGNDAELLPEFGDGAQHRALGHFPAQRMSELGNGSVACL